MILLWLILVPALGGLLAWPAGGRPRWPHLSRWIALGALALDLMSGRCSA